MRRRNTLYKAAGNMRLRHEDVKGKLVIPLLDITGEEETLIVFWLVVKGKNVIHPELYIRFNEVLWNRQKRTLMGALFLKNHPTVLESVLNELNIDEASVVEFVTDTSL